MLLQTARQTQSRMPDLSFNNMLLTCVLTDRMVIECCTAEVQKLGVEEGDWEMTGPGLQS